MEVYLINSTHSPLETIYTAFRQCYSKDTARGILEKASSIHSKEEIAAFVQDLVASGHVSPLEHVLFTFSIQGISRACSHQLIRHRIASYSQQSQRYVPNRNEADEFVVPRSIRKYKGLVVRYKEQVESIMDFYNEMREVYEIPAEDARYILPNSTPTNIVVSMNARALLHFLEDRTCVRAQEEIRELAWKMHDIVSELLPAVFAKKPIKCYKLGYCPEPKKMVCGLFKHKSEVLNDAGEQEDEDS